MGFLHDVGPCINTGMGLEPVSWQEIAAWQEQSGIDLEPWESRAIKAASSAYAHQASVSGKADCPPPERVVDHDPEKLQNHIKNIIRG